VHIALVGCGEAVTVTDSISNCLAVIMFSMLRAATLISLRNNRWFILVNFNSFAVVLLRFSNNAALL
jgi:hypothetical protein